MTGCIGLQAWERVCGLVDDARGAANGADEASDASARKAVQLGFRLGRTCHPVGCLGRETLHAGGPRANHLQLVPIANI